MSAVNPMTSPVPALKEAARHHAHILCKFVGYLLARQDIHALQYMGWQRKLPHTITMGISPSQVGYPCSTVYGLAKEAAPYDNHGDIS